MKNKIMMSLTLVLMTVWMTSFAMHIAEGFLPLPWAIFWSAVMVPIMGIAIFRVKKVMSLNPHNKYLIGVMAAFAFTLSSLKMPSVMGSSSHPTGVGLGAILLGPAIMVLIGLAVLLFQTLLLGHGGLTTLGANSFTMAFLGPLFSWLIYKSLGKLGVPQWLRVFLAATLGNWITYIATSAQLALAHPDAVSGFGGAFLKFLGVFALTQIPIAIAEGILTVFVLDYITGIQFEKEALFSLEKESLVGQEEVV